MNSKTTLFKILFIVIVYIAFCQTTNAQIENVDWVTSTGLADAISISPHKTATDNEGNIYMIGDFEGTVNFGGIVLTSANYNDIFIAKYDSAGNVLWAKRFNGGNQHETGYGIATDAENNIYFTGTFRDSILAIGDITFTNENFYFSDFVVKMDSNGNTIWGKSIRINVASGNDDDITNIAVDSTGAVVVTGNYYAWAGIDGDIVSSPNIPGIDSFIVKYDNNGNVLWYKSGFGYNSIEAIALDNNDNIFITGNYIAGLTFDNINLPSSGIFTAKYSPNGTIAWAKSGNLISGGVNNSHSIDTDSEGNVVITGGFYYFPITFGDFTLTASNGDKNAFVVKYNTSGDVLWAKSTTNTNDPLSSGTRGLSAKFDNSGNIYVYGKSSAAINFGAISLSQNEEEIYSFLARYDSEGYVNWARKVNSFSYYHENISLLLNNDNDIFISGICKVNTTFGDKIAEDGGIFLAKMDAPVLSNEDFTFNNSITLFPNPVKDILNVNSKESIDQINVFNALGQQIQSFNSINKETYTVNLSSLSNGYYLIEVISGNSKAQQKIIKS